MTTKWIIPNRTPKFRIQHPVSEREYLLHIERTRMSGTVHVVFDSQSPNAPRVRRVIHRKRRGYADFIAAAAALLTIVRWHDPRPCLSPRSTPVAERIPNPDHYVEWDDTHHAATTRAAHLATVALFVEQLAFPSVGRGVRLTDTVAAARTAADERRMTGVVTSVSRARMNLRAKMLADLHRALAIVGPHTVHFAGRRTPKRGGPTALGYRTDEVTALAAMWQDAYTTLEKLQAAVRSNEFWSAPEGTVSTTPLTVRALSPTEALIPAPKGFSFALDDLEAHDAQD